MGQLKPGSTYIYERSGSKIYAREFGKSERQLIGHDWEAPGGALDIMEQRITEKQEWSEIFAAANSNPALQEAVDRVKIIYRLTKNDRQTDHSK